MESRVFAAFDRRLDSVAAAPIGLALSGGGDSVALMRLAADWARPRGRRVIALTIDHGLNPESGDWTVFAGEAARALGCDWRPLRWEGEKPRAGLPAAARGARHALLAEAARAAGARVILTGHTADDALEGELMRVADAPTLGRLSEWRPSPAWPEGRGVFLLSPLLRAGRAELRAWLSGQGVTWIDDPANEDARFARTRARNALSSLPPAQLAGCAGARAPGQGGHCAEGLGVAAPPLVLCAPRDPPSRAGGGDAGVLCLVERDLTPARLAAALLCAAGTARPPRSEPLARLLRRLRSGERFTAVLVGARVEVRGEEVLVMREPGEQARSALKSLPLAPGEAVVWDGRFEIVAREPGLTVVPLAGHAARLPPRERGAVTDLPPAARAALPALLGAGGDVALPAPFGGGPAFARALAFDRLQAALGLIPDERALASRPGAPPPHGAARALTLS